MTAEVSHGRGGAGNINPDDTKYVDGAIVRAGPEGSHGDGAYSAGRGGMYFFFSSSFLHLADRMICCFALTLCLEQI